MSSCNSAISANSARSHSHHYARCLKCGKIINCSHYDINSAMRHIQEQHPEFEVLEDEASFEDDVEAERSKRRAFKHVAASVPVLPRLTSGETADDDDHAKREELSSPQHLVFTPVRSVSMDVGSADMKKGPGSATPFHLYRTSVEQWRPADGCLFCPKCKACKRPIIKSRGERVTDNSWVANCIMFWWPCCFCIFPPKDVRYYLYCASCRVFLGLYNRETNCFNPSREFLEHEAEEELF